MVLKIPVVCDVAPCFSAFSTFIRWQWLHFLGREGHNEVRKFEKYSHSDNASVPEDCSSTVVPVAETSHVQDQEVEILGSHSGGAEDSVGLGCDAV